MSYQEKRAWFMLSVIVVTLTAYFAFISLAVGFTDDGWDKSVRLWMVIQIFWAVSLVTWAIKALIIIVMYRRGAHA